MSAAAAAGGGGSNERGGAAAALGAWEPVLPIEELHAIYDRIQVAEIKVREDRLAPAPVAAAASSNPSFGTQPQRLAAALGLRSLAAHFTPLARGWRRAQEALPDAERKRQLVKLAERAVLSHSGTQSGLWYTSTHSEHARPMLSVCGGGLLEALTVCLAGAKTPGEFQPLLSAIVTLSELSALLGLDELCEACVGALSKVASVRKPAAYGAQEEAKKQLAALQALLALAASPIAGLLGSGWAVLLRAAAELDALTASLAAGSSTQVLMPGDQFDDDNSLVSASSSFDQPPVSALTKMWQIMGLSTPAPGAPGGSTGSAVARSGPSVGFTLLTVPPRAPAAAATGAAVKGGARGASVAGGASAGGAVVRRMTQAAAPSALRRDAGASLALWGLGPGHDVIEIVYGASAQLDGEEVVSFFRALCTVSREELEAPGTRPRLYSLQRLLDCAAANAPTRIRLIRSKLWAVCSAHLIMASCHAAPSVAQYSVNALFGLSAQLLARAAAGLAHFTQQEEALRPFVSVLRVCDEPEIRRLAVRCAVGAAGKHVTGLGSGWRTMLELLRRGGCDPNSGVVTEALAALSGAVAALYRRNTSNSNRNSSNSSNSGASRGAIVGGRGGAAPVGKAGPGAGVTISAAAAAGAKADSGWAAGGSHRYMVEAVGACLAVGTNATQPVHVGLSALALLVVCGDRLAEHHARLAAAAQARQHQQQQQYAEGMASALAPYDSARDHVPATSPDACWALLLTQLGDWAGSDARQPVAEAASQAVLDMMQAHGHLWGGAAWQVLLARAVPRLLRARAATGGATPGFVARAADAFPGLANQLTVVPPAVRGELLRQLVCAVTEWLGMAGGDNGGDGGEAGGDTVALGLRCLEDLAGRLAEEGDAAGWQVLLDALSTPVASEIASLSEALLQSSGAGDGGCDGDGGWPEAGEEGGAGGDDGSALRARAVLLLSLLRVLTDLQASRCAAMPWGVSARLAVLLVSCAGAAGDANEEMEARAAAAGAAAARLALGGGARAQGPSASLAPPHPAPPPPTTTVAERFGIPELSPTPSQTASNLADDILGHSEASAGAAAAHPAGAPHPGQPHHHSHNHHPHGAGGDASVVVSAGWARDGSGACLLLGRLEAELTGAALDVLDACCVRERAGAGAAGGGVYGGAVTSGAGGVGGRLPEWAGAEVAAAAGAGPSQLLASFALGLVTRAAREAAAAAAASAARHSISGHAADAPPPPPPLAPWTAQLRAGHAARSLRTYASLALTGDVTTVASSTSGSGSSGSGGASMRRAGEHAASAVSQLAPLCCALVASPHGRLRIAAADFFDAHAGPFALAAAAGGPVSVGVAQAGGGDVVRRRVMALSSASGSGGGSNLADDDDNLA
ncbi:hypothetical protein FOA52_013348 [Chlamydomonas sp. UWO 241]|nr:hypothetical protein FOA52_013348 [Chlamydomonas sp. UWO 241]